MRASIVWVLLMAACDNRGASQVPVAVAEGAVEPESTSVGIPLDPGLVQSRAVYRKVADEARKKLDRMDAVRARLSMLDGEIEQEKELTE